MAGRAPCCMYEQASRLAHGEHRYHYHLSLVGRGGGRTHGMSRTHHARPLDGLRHCGSLSLAPPGAAIGLAALDATRLTSSLDCM